MENDNIYNELIEKLQKMKPELTNEEELTERIMEAVKLQSVKKPAKLILLIRPVITAAAVFLTGLLVLQQMDIPKLPSEPVALSQKELIVNNSFINCFTSEKTEKDSVNFINRYLCYVKQSKLESNNSKMLKMKFQNFYQ